MATALEGCGEEQVEDLQRDPRPRVAKIEKESAP
jgi:hypothetical protein